MACLDPSKIYTGEAEERVAAQEINVGANTRARIHIETETAALKSNDVSPEVTRPTDSNLADVNSADAGVDLDSVQRPVYPAHPAPSSTRLAPIPIPDDDEITLLPFSVGFFEDWTAMGIQTLPSASDGEEVLDAEERLAPALYVFALQTGFSPSDVHKLITEQPLRLYFLAHRVQNTTVITFAMDKFITDYVRSPVINVRDYAASVIPRLLVHEYTSGGMPYEEAKRWMMALLELADDEARMVREAALRGLGQVSQMKPRAQADEENDDGEMQRDGARRDGAQREVSPPLSSSSFPQIQLPRLYPVPSPAQAARFRRIALRKIVRALTQATKWTGDITLGSDVVVSLLEVLVDTARRTSPYALPLMSALQMNTPPTKTTWGKVRNPNRPSQQPQQNPLNRPIRPHQEYEIVAPFLRRLLRGECGMMAERMRDEAIRILADE